MKAPNDDRLLHRSGEPEPEPLYETLGGVLQRMVMRTFEASQEDAEALVRDVFFSYYGTNEARSDARAWLTGTVCRSAETYLRSRGVAVPEDVVQEREIRSLLSHRDALAILPSHAREAVRMRYEEQKTYPEIAAELDVSADTAQRLIGKAMVKLRRWLKNQ